MIRNTNEVDNNPPVMKDKKMAFNGGIVCKRKQ